MWLIEWVSVSKQDQLHIKSIGLKDLPIKISMWPIDVVVQYCFEKPEHKTQFYQKRLKKEGKEISRRAMCAHKYTLTWKISSFNQLIYPVESSWWQSVWTTDAWEPIFFNALCVELWLSWQAVPTEMETSGGVL